MTDLVQTSKLYLCIVLGLDVSGYLSKDFNGVASYLVHSAFMYTHTSLLVVL